MERAIPQILPPKLSTYLPNQTPEVLDGDVILKIDNATVHNPEDISLAMQNKKLGDNILLTVLRSGQKSQDGMDVQGKEVIS